MRRLLFSLIAAARHSRRRCGANRAAGARGGDLRGRLLLVRRKRFRSRAGRDLDHLGLHRRQGRQSNL